LGESGWGALDTHSIDEDDVQYCQQINVPPPENPLPSRPPQLTPRRPAHIIHSLNSKLDLVFPQVERPAVLRQVRDEEEARARNRQADDAVHDEQPLPPGQAVQAVHALVDARLQVAAEHGSRGRRCVENAGALRELARLVPGAQDHVRGRVEDALQQADEEADRDDVVGGCHGGQAEGEHCPDELAGRDPDGGADFCQDDLAGDLADDVAAGPGDVDHVELVAVHGQIFFHARDVGIGDVGLVEVFDEVALRVGSQKMDSDSKNGDAYLDRGS
jgi:hypothetical protein